jgi:hypothetical protein
MANVQLYELETTAQTQAAGYNVAIEEQENLDFVANTGSIRKYYTVVYPTARAAEFENGTEEHRFKMAIVAYNVFSRADGVPYVEAYEEEYTKIFG